MFKTPDELKLFITWAKDNKIKRVKVDAIEFEISDLAFIPELNEVPSSQDKVPHIDNGPTPEDALDDEELLTWSVRN